MTATYTTSPLEEAALVTYNDKWIWHNTIERALSSGLTWRGETQTFRGPADKVDKAIHSAQMALLQHRTKAILAGRITCYVPVVMKRGNRLNIFNRPITDWRQYVHRARPEVQAALEVAERNCHA